MSCLGWGGNWSNICGCVVVRMVVLRCCRGVGDRMARGEVVETILDITRGKLLPGDYHYQSPEMLLAEPNIDCTSDLFSLSVCLYEAVLGQLPFSVSGSLAETINMLCQYQWPSLREFRRDVPSQWDDFFKTTLNRDRKLRLQSAADWRNAIEALPVS